VKIQPFRYVVGQAERQLAPMGGSVSTTIRAPTGFWLEAGRYYLSAAHSVGAGLIGEPAVGPWRWAHDVRARRGYAPVFYPAWRNPARPAPSNFTPARNAGASISGSRPCAASVFVAALTLFPRGPGKSLCSWRRAANGARPPSAWVPSRPRTLIPKARSRFAVCYPAPTRSPRCGIGKEPFLGIMPLEAGAANIDGLELTLKPAAELKGRVRFDGQSRPART